MDEKREESKSFSTHYRGVLKKYMDEDWDTLDLFLACKSRLNMQTAGHSSHACACVCGSSDCSTLQGSKDVCVPRKE